MRKHLASEGFLLAMPKSQEKDRAKGEDVLQRPSKDVIEMGTKQILEQCSFPNLTVRICLLPKYTVGVWVTSIKSATYSQIVTEVGERI